MISMAEYKSETKQYIYNFLWKQLIEFVNRILKNATSVLGSLRSVIGMLTVYNPNQPSSFELKLPHPMLNSIKAEISQLQNTVNEIWYLPEVYRMRAGDITSKPCFKCGQMTDLNISCTNKHRFCRNCGINLVLSTDEYVGEISGFWTKKCSQCYSFLNEDAVKILVRCFEEDPNIKTHPNWVKGKISNGCAFCKTTINIVSHKEQNAIHSICGGCLLKCFSIQNPKLPIQFKRFTLLGDATLIDNHCPFPSCKKTFSPTALKVLLKDQYDRLQTEFIAINPEEAISYLNVIV
jgi:hypothetical protein